METARGKAGGNATDGDERWCEGGYDPDVWWWLAEGEPRAAKAAGPIVWRPRVGDGWLRRLPPLKIPLGVRHGLYPAWWTTLSLSEF